LATAWNAEAQEPPVAPTAPQTAEVEGRVVGPDGEPIAEAVLALSTRAGQVVETTDTDSAGLFRLPAVVLGRYDLRVEADGYAVAHFHMDVAGDLRDQELKLAAVSGVYRTVVQSQNVPLPVQNGTSTTVYTHQDVASLPGGTTREFNEVVSTTPGVTSDNYGAIHVRGNFAGLQLRVDGIQLPPALQDRLQQLLEPQIIEETKVIVGGLPAEYGEDVAGVVDVTTRRPNGPIGGEAQLLYGSNVTLQAQANAAGQIGPVNAVIAGSIGTTNEGLNPPAASPVLHDQLVNGRLFLRLEDQLTPKDRLEFLGVYAQSQYQIPINPTLLPLSASPAGTVGRGTDSYGNSAPTFVPYDANPTEGEAEVFTALSWFHKFNERSELQVAPFYRYQNSNLDCNPVLSLGATADPGSTCSSVTNKVNQGGLQASVTWGEGPHDFKAGLLLDGQASNVTYSQFFRDDASASGGPDPATTVSGVDHVNVYLGGVYIQDHIQLGKLTLFPGLRLDVQQAELQQTGQTSTLWGPSVRFGAAYAFKDTLVLHAFVGELWQPPLWNAPTAARVLGLVPPDQSVPFDLKAEFDYYAEIGIADRITPQLSVDLTFWGRLSQWTLDDAEVGDTALTADYNYQHGRATGVELASNLVLGRNLRAFANLSVEVAQGQGIATAQYLFTPEQLAFAGYQSVDNAQLVTANVGADVSDNSGRAHFSTLVQVNSGLRTGPTNQSTLPANTVIDATVRYHFADWPLKPEVAIDVLNVFNELYAYRIATGSLAGSAYGPLQQFQLRLLFYFGG
jgi:outer membrane cobalamin receptor